MPEGVDRVGGIDLDPERVAPALVVDGDEQAVRSRVPEQRHLDAVAAPVIQLAHPDLGHRAHDLSSVRRRRAAHAPKTARRFGTHRASR
jgi:hypothetical protein